MLTTIFKIFGCIYIITWFLTMVSYAYTHFRIAFLEKYWNSASEEEFMQKIKTLLLDVNPNIIIFSNRNLMYKLNYIYSTMNHLEKSRFRVAAFKNGVKPRIRKIIEHYY